MPPLNGHKQTIDFQPNIQRKKTASATRWSVNERMHTHSDRHDLEIFRYFTMQSVILAVEELKNVLSVENNSDALNEINDCMSKVQSI